MSSQIMLVSSVPGETRIATLAGETLKDLHLEQEERERRAGNIYRGHVVRTHPAFQAAFVEYGEERHGFLSANDLSPSSPEGQGNKRATIQSLFSAGQTVMVQVQRDSLKHKGATLTTNISLAGRYMVFNPTGRRNGISRQVADPAARAQLRESLDALTHNAEGGVIVRTAGIGRSLTELRRDLGELRKQWLNVQQAYARGSGPALLYREPPAAVRVLRDYFREEVEEVWVDEAESFQELLAYFKRTLPRFQKRLKLYVGEKSLFSAYGVEHQISALHSNRAPLPSGGGIVIEVTEALVSVDVNSGRSAQENNIEETALRTNLEAAAEIGRQLRLRNLGGLVVLDFIDMDQAANRKRVSQAVKDALQDDKARTRVGTISSFGLLELSRQRIGIEHKQVLYNPCSACAGQGQVPTPRTQANELLRLIREKAAEERFGKLISQVPIETANYLHNEHRQSLHDLEQEFSVAILVQGDLTMLPGAPLAVQGEVETLGSTAEPLVASSASAVATPEEVAPNGGGEGTSSRRRRGSRGGRGRQHKPDADKTVLGEASQTPAPGEPQPLEAAAEFTPAEASGSSRNAPQAQVEQQTEPKSAPPKGRTRRPRGANRSATSSNTIQNPNPTGQNLMGQNPTAQNSTTGNPGPHTRSNGKPDKRMLFHSTHRITDEEALRNLPPALVRNLPFALLVEATPFGELLYDSRQTPGHLG